MTRAIPAPVHGPTSRNSAAATPRQTAPGLVYVALLVAVVVLFSLIRIRLLNMPLERDEGEYAYGGQLLLHGLAPYQHLYSVKLPGVYASYALIVAAFGQSPAGIRLGLLLVNVVSILLLFHITRRLLGDLSALVAAASYALLSAGADVNGVAAHATNFVVVFALAAILVLLKALDSGKRALIFVAGLLFGTAFLMKQPGLVFAAWAAIYLLYRRWTRPIPWRRLSTQLGLLLAGVALPYAITCMLMLWSGEFREFWFWTFSYVRTYGSAVPLSDGLKLLRRQGSLVLEAAPGVWLIAFAGLTSVAWSVRARSQMFLATSLLLFSFAGVSAGLYFRLHYFILVLPAASILAGVAIGCAMETCSRRGNAALTAIPALVFLLAFTSSIYGQRAFFFRLSPAEACRYMYGANPFPEAVEVGNYIQAHTAKTDTVAVLGSEPEIYFYSQRLSASAYIYMYPLFEPKTYTAGMQRQMIEQIEASPPAMLVLVNVPSSWIAYPNPSSMQMMLDWARAYIAADYVQDGVVVVGNPTEYVWGEAARNRDPGAGPSLLLFRRK